VTVTVSSLDDSSAFVEAKALHLPSSGSDPHKDKYILIIGNQIFGLTDTSERTVLEADESVTYRVVVPLPLLLSVREIRLRPLFWQDDPYELSAPIPDFSLGSGSEKLVLIQKTEQISTFVLFGNRLKGATILEPAGVALQSFDGSGSDDTIRRIDLKAEQLKAFKEIVLQKGASERPVFVAIPSGDPKDASTKPSIAVKGRVTVGMDEATITGDGLEKLKAVRFKKLAIKFVLAEDKKSVTLTGLFKAGVTTTPTEKDLECELESGQKTTVQIDVVNSKIETVERDKN
jgi:hypothetical protein